MNILTHMLFLICVSIWIERKGYHSIDASINSLFLVKQGKRVLMGYSFIKAKQKLILHRVWEALSPGIDRLPEARVFKDWLTFSCGTLAFGMCL